MLESKLVAVNTAADMVILGKRKFEGAMQSDPYFPDTWRIEELSLKIWDETGFGGLPSKDRQQIAAAWSQVGVHMHLRAEMQLRQHWLGKTRVKQNYQAKIWEQTDQKVNLNPANFDIRWGLLSTALIVRSADFDKLWETIFGEKTFIGTGGMVSDSFINELGPIALVRRSDKVHKTIRHEDAHVLTMILGTNRGNIALESELKSDHFDRVLLKHHPRQGDAQLCLNSLRRMRQSAKQKIAGEFQAHLWDREIPTRWLLLNEEDQGKMAAAATATIEAAYHRSSGLSDIEKIQTIFTAFNCGDQLNQYIYGLEAVVKKAMSVYPGSYNKFEWVASRFLVLRAGLPVRAYAQVLSVDMRETQPFYTTNPAGVLAESLATHAVMGMHLAESNLDDRLPEYAYRLGKIFKNKSLYDSLVTKYGIDENFLKSEIIRKSLAKFPPGMAGECTRLLNASLT